MFNTLRGLLAGKVVLRADISSERLIRELDDRFSGRKSKAIDFKYRMARNAVNGVLLSNDIIDLHGGNEFWRRTNWSLVGVITDNVAGKAEVKFKLVFNPRFLVVFVFIASLFLLMAAAILSMDAGIGSTVRILPVLLLFFGGYPCYIEYSGKRMVAKFAGMFDLKAE